VYIGLAWTNVISSSGGNKQSDGGVRISMELGVRI